MMSYGLNSRRKAGFESSTIDSGGVMPLVSTFRRAFRAVSKESLVISPFTDCNPAASTLSR